MLLQGWARLVLDLVVVFAILPALILLSAKISYKLSAVYLDIVLYCGFIDLVLTDVVL